MILHIPFRSNFTAFTASYCIYLPPPKSIFFQHQTPDPPVLISVCSIEGKPTCQEAEGQLEVPGVVLGKGHLHRNPGRFFVFFIGSFHDQNVESGVL